MGLAFFDKRPRSSIGFHEVVFVQRVWGFVRLWPFWLFGRILHFSVSPTRAIVKKAAQVKEKIQQTKEKARQKPDA